ncbi:MAG: hypothetical protein MUF81_05900, partial [Verrucomicrobia bacterium]|nr:hypothetical protein [Verrucomicrobiota bacterium]
MKNKFRSATNVSGLALASLVAAPAWALITHSMKTSKTLSLVLFAITLAAIHPGDTQAAPGDEHWDYQFRMRGVDEPIWTIVTNGMDLYIGGLFQLVGDTAANRIARFDGLRWSPLGGGLLGNGLLTQVRAIAFQGTNLYA